jgi:NhaP-type Na+/H+ or K+/H+ antiporter
MNPSLQLAVILTLGIAAQWIAWRAQFPSIVLLLGFGFLAGPVFGFIHPDVIFGASLFPIVSLSVAVILFEGGLSLRFSELPKVGFTIWNLVTVGTLVTWALIAIAAHHLLGFPFLYALLLGAILLVTGPTVIGPLLRHIRPKGFVGSALKWEGILIDPIGAVLAVLVLEIILTGGLGQAIPTILLGLGKTAFIGFAMGFLAAVVIILILRFYWLPDFLHSSVSLMMVIASFTLANWIQKESGLLAVTTMGIVLANQKRVNIHRIVEFKENLRIILISSLFVLLAARLDLTYFSILRINTFLFIFVLIVCVRPLAVLASTLGSKLKTPERLFLMSMAPRGIVAAAIASIFSIELAQHGHSYATELVSVTFLVIVSTVVVYGFAAPLMARALGISTTNPQGVLIIGAHDWARSIGKTLKDEGFEVSFIDGNYRNIAEARMEGLSGQQKDVLQPFDLAELDLNQTGHLLAMTSNDEINALASIRFSSVLGTKAIYQLQVGKMKDSEKQKSERAHDLRGRILFDGQATFGRISSLFLKGAIIKKTALTKEFDYDCVKQQYGDDLMPLFLITSERSLHVFSVDQKLSPRIGQTLISLAISSE